MTRATVAAPAAPDGVRLGVAASLAQFSLLVGVNALVGGMIGPGTHRPPAAGHAGVRPHRLHRHPHVHRRLWGGQGHHELLRRDDLRPHRAQTGSRHRLAHRPPRPVRDALLTPSSPMRCRAGCRAAVRGGPRTEPARLSGRLGSRARSRGRPGRVPGARSPVVEERVAPLPGLEAKQQDASGPVAVEVGDGGVAAVNPYDSERVATPWIVVLPDLPDRRSDGDRLTVQSLTSLTVGCCATSLRLSDSLAGRVMKPFDAAVSQQDSLGGQEADRLGRYTSDFTPRLSAIQSEILVVGPPRRW
jgi:hypothetical protein